jgi:hypothetical protein
MKKLTILLVFIALGFNAICQNDTTGVKSNELTAEEQLFQGEYEVNNRSSVNPVFCFSQFTVKKNQRHFSVHGSGLFAGFSNLSSRDLSQIGAFPNAQLKLSSFEIGLTAFGMDAQLSKKQGWLLFAGLGVKVQQYNADLNTAFVMEDNITGQSQPSVEGRLYSKSRLVQWYLHAPIMLEYQAVSFRGQVVFVQAGFELGLKLSSKSSVVYRDERNKKFKEKMGRGMNINPLTVDAKVEVGFNDFALYARYGLIALFRKNRGPEVVPVAAGVIWHF